MEFYGAEHYFFWQGIIEGLNRKSMTDLPELIDNINIFGNETSLKCCEAFEWGYYWGLWLTTKEYNYMIKPVKRRKKTIRKTKKTTESKKEETETIEYDKVVWN